MFRKKKMKWSQADRDELLQCGLPLDVYENQSAWQYFIDHGNAPSVETMERHLQERLCNFLDAREDFASCVAANRLKYLLDRNFW